MEGDWEWGWEAVAAIGQCTSVIVAAVALYFALRKDKLKVLVDSIWTYDSNTNIRWVNIRVISNSYIPFTVIQYRLRDPKYPGSYLVCVDCQEEIEPYKKVQIAKMDLNLLIEKDGFTSHQHVAKNFSIIDNLGNEHYYSYKLSVKIKMLLYKIFGRKRKK